MVKYRILAREELEEVQDEFVRFLAINSVVADDWEKLKAEEPDKADGLIEVFSDIFWERALSKIDFLEVRTPKDLKVFKFNEKEAELIQLKIKEDSDFDLTINDDLAKVASGAMQVDQIKPELFSGSKKYKSERNREIFEMLEMGASPTKEIVFQAFKSMIQKK